MKDEEKKMHKQIHKLDKEGKDKDKEITMLVKYSDDLKAKSNLFMGKYE